MSGSKKTFFFGAALLALVCSCSGKIFSKAEDAWSDGSDEYVENDGFE